MPDQSKKMIGKDGREYEVPTAVTQAALDEFIDSQKPSIYDKIAQAAEESTPLGAVISSLRGPTTAEASLNKLPMAGATLGTLVAAPTVAGTVGGAALGGASGESMRRLGMRLIGKGEPVTASSPLAASLQEAGAIGAEGAKQGALATIPLAAKAAAPMAQTGARNLWQIAAGATKPGAGKAAGQVLESGNGLLMPSNTEKLTTAARIADIAAPAGQKGDLWPAVYAHGEGVPTMADTAIWKIPAKLTQLGSSGVAQAIYSAAKSADPIGQLLRMAVMSQLSGGGNER